jgi:peptidoglycan/xylan/chitin deacetylase (PgdA/CDA1 family)
MRPAPLLSLLLLSALGLATEREIAVTFDDLPIAGGGSRDEATRRELTHRLLWALTERNIPATGFVNETGLYDAGQFVDARAELLQMWLAAGLDLGNHSFSHPDLHRVTATDFTADILRGQETTARLLAAYSRKPRYFRHPYLHTGRSLEVRQAVEAYLEQHGYRVAPVTIDNSEWIFARAYDLAIQDEDTRLAEQIGRDYVGYMLEIIRYYEHQSQHLFGRNIRHVLLLHANLLNASWFGRLADTLSDAGYQFVTLTAALSDPAYESEDTYVGPGGISWIHRWAMSLEIDPKEIAQEPGTPAYILSLAGQREHNYETGQAGN